MSSVASVRVPIHDWAIALGGVALATIVFIARGRPPARADEIDFDVTAIPADARELDCAVATAIAPPGTACAFTLGADGVATPAGAPPPASGQLPLRPYVTMENELVLLAGLFQEPHVVEWLAEATRRGATDRVRLSCHGRFFGPVSPAAVRFGSKNPWRLDGNKAYNTATVEACSVAP